MLSAGFVRAQQGRLAQPVPLVGPDGRRGSGRDLGSMPFAGQRRLDAYRGYTGQSRSRRPTHTWNITKIAVVDHGGTLADRRDAGEQVADALARQPDPSLAARSDPWTLDRQLRELIAEHERVLAGRPLDRHEALAAATDEMRSARSRLATWTPLSPQRSQLDGQGPLAGLSRHGRDQRRSSTTGSRVTRAGRRAP